MERFIREQASARGELVTQSDGAPHVSLWGSLLFAYGANLIFITAYDVIWIHFLCLVRII